MKKNNYPSATQDLHDSKKDQRHLQAEETIIDLPEVKDIPGQENIHPPKLNAFADVTISSDDEEGKGLLDNLNEEDDLEEDNIDEDSDVTPEEKELLEQSENQTGSRDDIDQARATLDDADDDGDPLNEENDVSGGDLDVPGSEADDENEEIGEEDEENNSYSLGGDRD